MEMYAFALVILADIYLTWWQSLLFVAACSLALIGAGIVLILAGRTGMKAKDISPGWRIGYTIWFYGGWWFIVLGVFFPVAILAMILIVSMR